MKLFFFVFLLFCALTVSAGPFDFSKIVPLKR
ncbi:hypothetical protein OESDEN_05592 [Oesophagostomum dentatum]|uniref:Uncharacterized protein n=1 Tax=Oesophagostomum dentatum TaxID=61180 RepID=A0A0B1TB36_OESDE|nr:hypothetical protein OESDEN_05592 [Oesophagostomum dentatum]